MPNETESYWEQAGWATYAGIMLFGLGLVGIVDGVWALRYNELDAQLVLAEGNVELWGWGALIGGILFLATGIGVFTGKTWARWTGILLAMIAIPWSVAWAAIQPTQALIGALLAASIVYALATHPVTVSHGQ